MEGIIQQRLKEFNQLQQDYDELYEKFQLSHKLYDEKERIYQKQMKELTDIIIKLKAKNSKLKNLVSSDKDMKESFQQDVLKLQELFTVMEQKEKDFIQQIQSLTEENHSLNIQRQQFQNEIRSLEQENFSLRHQLSEDSVPKNEFNTVQLRCQYLESMIKVDYVAKTDFQQLQSDYQQLQHNLSNNYISKELYQALESSYQTMTNSLKSQYIDLISYQRLQENYENVFHEKKLLEDTIQLSQENNQLLVREKSELQAKILSLKERIEKDEENIASQKQELSNCHSEIVKLSNENSIIYREKQDLLQQIESLEKQKLQFVLQVQTMKQQMKRETDQRLQITAEKHDMEKELHQMKLDYSTKLIESNSKLTSLYENTEYQFRTKISELSNLNQVLNDKQANLQALYDQLFDKNGSLSQQVHQLEREKNEVRSQLAVLQAHHENASREISDYQQQVIELKEEKFHLQQKIIELNHTMDEFRATIVSELSPSIGRYLGNNMTSTIHQTLSQSQSQNQILASSSTSPVGPRRTVSPPKSPKYHSYIDTTSSSPKHNHYIHPQPLDISSSHLATADMKRAASTPLISHHNQQHHQYQEERGRTSQSHFTSSATTTSNTTVDVQRSVKTHKSLSGLHETRGSEKVLSPKHRKTSESQLLVFNPPPPPPAPAIPSFAAISALEMSGAGGIGGVGGSGGRDVRSESVASTTSSLSHDVAAMGNDVLMTSAELTTRREVNGQNTSYEGNGGSAGHRMTFSSTGRSSSSRPASPINASTSRSNSFRRDYRIPQSLPAEAIDTPVSTALPATTKSHNNTNTNTSNNRHSSTTLIDVPDYLADSLSPPRVNTPSRLSSSRHTVEVGSPLDDSLHMQDHSIVKEYSRSL